LINEIDINVLKGIVTFLIYVIYCILFFYLAMSLGQLVNRHKKWMSFGALVAINTGVSTVKMFIYILLSALNIDYMQDIMFNFYVNDVIMAVLSVVYFVLVTKILENKLNLE
jgi:LytS/YehU family sensor histidine kinase